jgi:medium-chain acyl-[acyl-carrier-protein] hydrolase
MEIIPPILQADGALLASHVVDTEQQPLPVPIDVLTGVDDSRVTHAQAEGWRQETSADFRLHQIEGDHFFIHSARESVLSIVGECRP